MTIGALLWLVMLWYAAPLLAGHETVDFPGRIRYLLFPACALPLILAACHILNVWALFAIAAVLCVVRYRYGRRSTQQANPWDWITGAFVLLVASPNVVRPPLEGDSLAYHLPNAMAWVQAGSLDPSWMRYWWYPGASEAAVAGVIGTGGLWVAGIPSLLAAALVATRIGVWLRELNVPSFTATALSAAFITIPAVAFQTYDERNDLILAAWFIESLWLLRTAGWRAAFPMVLLALTKPYGWIFGLAAIACMGRPKLIAALIPAGLWALHDAILSPHAQVSIASTSIASPWSTTIAANMPASLAVLTNAVVHQGPAMICFFLAPWIALFARGDLRRIAFAGVVAEILSVFTPFSYSNPFPQLASGESLRFALPAVAAGVIVFAPLARKTPIPIALLAAATAFAGITELIVTFSNDAVTFAAFACAGAVLVFVALSFRFRAARALAGVLTAVFLVLGSEQARTRAAAFYADEMPRHSGTPTSFFSWFRDHPHASEVVDIRSGKLLVMAPSAHILDAGSIECVRAAAEHAWIVVGTDRDVPDTLRESRMRSVRRCGRTIFDDGDVVVAAP